MRLVFVYNANAGLVAGMLDSVHKVVSPATYPCSLCAVTYFAVFLGYGTQLIAMISFYIIVSLWFHFWRYRFVKRADQFTMPWPRPKGY